MVVVRSFVSCQRHGGGCFARPDCTENEQARSPFRNGRTARRRRSLVVQSPLEGGLPLTIFDADSYHPHQSLGLIEHEGEKFSKTLARSIFLWGTTRRSWRSIPQYYHRGTPTSTLWSDGHVDVRRSERLPIRRAICVMNS